MSGRCAICQELIDPDAISALKCGHTFHFDCISHWLGKTSSCPICRCSARRSTDIIRQLFFDYGEDSLAGVGSPIPSGAARRVRELSNKVRELESLISVKDKLLAARANECNVAYEQVRQLRREIAQVVSQEAAANRENEELQKKIRLLQKIHELTEGDNTDEDSDENVDVFAAKAYMLSWKVLKRRMVRSAVEGDIKARALKKLERENKTLRDEIEQLNAAMRAKDEVGEVPSGRKTKKMNKWQQSTATSRHVEAEESDCKRVQDACRVYKLSSIKTTSLAANKAAPRRSATSDSSDSNDDSVENHVYTGPVLRGKRSSLKTDQQAKRGCARGGGIVSTSGRVPRGSTAVKQQIGKAVHRGEKMQATRASKGGYYPEDDTIIVSD